MTQSIDPPDPPAKPPIRIKFHDAAPKPAALPERKASTLVKLLGMLGSRFDAEALAAGRKAHQLVRSLGLTWAQIIGTETALPEPEPPPSLLEMARLCHRHRDLFDTRNREFIAVMGQRLVRGQVVSGKQVKWLYDLYERAQAAEQRRRP
jgi:hypothetical protein